MRLPPPPPVARAVAETPADRDRVLDLLRATALAVVVLGHGIMAVIGWAEAPTHAHGVPVVGNALASYPWARWATWLLQVMPLFFVAGGAVNARSWRGGRRAYPAWLWGRVARLLRPAWVYLLVVAPLSGIATAIAPEGWAGPLLGLTTQLLWFVGAYVLVCALTPLAVAAHARNPLLAPAVLLAAVALVDWLRLGLHLPAAVGLLNFVTAWAFAAQLGLLLDDGLLERWRGLGLAAAAVLGNLALIAVGPYPVSMVGLPGEPFSNMAPPSLVLALHSCVLARTGRLGATGAGPVRSPPPALRGIVAVNLTAMTLYLWHLPVLIVLTVALHAMGLDRPVTFVDGQPVPAGGYWLWSIAFLAVFLTGVVGIVRLAWPAELAPLPHWIDPPRSKWPSEQAQRRASALAAVGAVLVGVGALALSATGLAGFPTRIASYAGVPLNAAAAIALMLAGGLGVRSAAQYVRTNHAQKRKVATRSCANGKSDSKIAP